MTSRTGFPDTLRGQLVRGVRSGPDRTLLSELAIGIGAALVATGVRYALPLDPAQIPTLTVVVALAIVTAMVGIAAGIATAVCGGLLCWYLFLTPINWTVGHQAWVSALGYTVVSTVIITTSYLYRASEQRHREQELAALTAEARNSQLFAREMAHRLKNALTVVQSIAFQTIGAEGPSAGALAGRLKALADANELLTEHVQAPSAGAREVIETALKPFEDRHRFRLEGSDAAIPAQQVVALALAIHELATNALKYGSLSDPGGHVGIGIEDLGDRLRVSWAEHDGPPVAARSEPGFGSRLLRRSGMNARLDLDPAGLRFSMEIAKS